MKIRKNLSFGSVVAIFGAAAFAAAIVLSLLCAALLQRGILKESTMPYLSAIITAIAALFATGAAAGRAKEKRLLVTLGTAAVYFVCCLVVKLAFIPGTTGYMLRNALIIFISAVLTSLLPGARKTGRRYRRRDR